MSECQYEKFSVPADFHFQKLPGRDEKVTVVSIFGKSRNNVHQSKASMVNAVLDNQVFLGQVHEKDHNYTIGNTCRIEGHYDSKQHVVYLHLQSLYDSCSLVEICQKAADEISQMGFHGFMHQAEYTHARALLYLFSISHLLVLVHPGSSFDVSYVRLFRILDIIRQKVLPSVSEALRGLGVSKEWVLSGRPCSPRVLFVFEMSTLDGSSSYDPENLILSKSRSQKTPPIKRLQHAIEDQIYRILRKSRIITNISNNSLFAVPANQEFVFVHARPSETCDPTQFYINQLRNCSFLSKDLESPRSRSYQTNRRTNRSSSAGNDVALRSVSSTMSTLTPDPNSFRDFLWQHIELAHHKGFDDNVGRNPLPAVFELPTAATWFKVFNRMYEFFLTDQSDSKARPHFNTLHSLLDINTRFSESRCAKILPLAEGAYQEGLPQHYTKSYHLNKLTQAKRIFAQHARGPAGEKYVKQLEENCEKIWKTGRQLCEEVSLTGNHCVNELHRLPDSFDTEESRHLPEMCHSSQVKTKATCNCGHKQAERDDPFDHKSANFDFYTALEVGCCDRFEHFKLPVFEPSTTEVKAGVSPGHPSTTESARPGLILSRKDSSRFDIDRGMSNLSLALSLGQSGGSTDLYSHATHSSSTADHSQPGSEVSPEPSPVAIETTSDTHISKPVRQHSTTEYLPGMLHSQAPPGLLPKFPSWSLICLGKYSTYNPQQGLDQPGFLHGSNFLLPWEVTVRGDREKWPSINETSLKKAKLRKGQKDVGEVTVRFYLGIEYECPRGHRFTLSTPEKIFKAPATGIFKENAHKVITNDMPLYFPCHCRSSKGYMAQLARIFLVVPEGPVEARLNPQVQPAPLPCPVFHPGTDQPITLTPGGVWVLRLPYIYLGEKGAYLMPNDPQQMARCRLMKGTFLFTEVTAK